MTTSSFIIQTKIKFEISCNNVINVSPDFYHKRKCQLTNMTPIRRNKPNGPNKIQQISVMWSLVNGLMSRSVTGGSSFHFLTFAVCSNSPNVSDAIDRIIVTISKVPTMIAPILRENTQQQLFNLHRVFRCSSSGIILNLYDFYDTFS